MQFHEHSKQNHNVGILPRPFYYARMYVHYQNDFEHLIYIGLPWFQQAHQNYKQQAMMTHT